MKLEEPNGCFWCGAGQREHGQRWVMGVGFHTWSAPSDAMRKRRMLARRMSEAAEQLEPCPCGESRPSLAYDRHRDFPVCPPSAVLQSPAGGEAGGEK